MLPRQTLVDPEEPLREAQRGLRVLQGAFALTFVVGLLNGALMTQTMAAYRAGASGSFADRTPLLLAGQTLYWAALAAVLYGVHRLATAPAAPGAGRLAWASLGLLSVDAALELSGRFLLPHLSADLPPASVYQATALLGTALHGAAFVCLVECLRLLEDPAGGGRLAELRWGFYGALAARYAFSWLSSSLPLAALFGGLEATLWGTFLLREVLAAACFGLLLWLLELTFAALASRRAAVAAGAAPAAPVAQVAVAAGGAGVRDMVIGGLVFSIGTLITVLSYTARGGGGRYVIAYGAILAGLVQFLRGLSRHGGR